MRDYVNDPIMAAATGRQSGGLGFMDEIDFFSDSFSDPYSEGDILDSVFGDPMDSWGGDDIFETPLYTTTATGGDSFTSVLNSLIGAAPDILQVYQQYEAGESLAALNEQRIARGLMPISQSQMNQMNSLYAQNPQMMQSYMMGSGGGFDLASMLPILLIAGAAIFLLPKLMKK